MSCTTTEALSLITPCGPYSQYRDFSPNSNPFIRAFVYGTMSLATNLLVYIFRRDVTPETANAIYIVASATIVVVGTLSLGAEAYWTNRKVVKVSMQECETNPIPDVRAVNTVLKKAPNSAFSRWSHLSGCHNPLNKIDTNGYYPLEYNHRTEILINSGADPFYKTTPQNQSFIEKTITAGNIDLIPKLLMDPNNNAQVRPLSHSVQGALMMCVRNAATITCLVQTCGFSPNAKFQGESILMHWVKNENIPVAVIQELIRLGAKTQRAERYIKGILENTPVISAQPMDEFKKVTRLREIYQILPAVSLFHSITA